MVFLSKKISTIKDWFAAGPRWWLSVMSAVFILLILALYWRNPPKSSSSLKFPGYSYAIAPAIDGWGDRRLQRGELETDWSLVVRLNRLVFASFYHCEYRQTSRLLDRLATSFFSDSFELHGMLMPENLCGYCHQAAYILARALEANGIKAWPLNLNGHVVTSFKLENQSWIVDPDSGLGPFLYENLSWDSIEILYKPLTQDVEGFVGAYRTAYKTIKDDYPYFDMGYLNRVEEEQRFWIRFTEIMSYVLGAIGLFIFFLGFTKPNVRGRRN